MLCLQGNKELKIFTILFSLFISAGVEDYSAFLVLRFEQERDAAGLASVPTLRAAPDFPSAIEGLLLHPFV
jgi:hypothetical protein